jgi:glycosyltransferase involved in cell wall biosynthesis
VESKIDFEIICVDDASQDYQSNNGEIQFLSNCIYNELPKTSGEVQFENLLASKSRKDWLLFLDCDLLS